MKKRKISWKSIVGAGVSIAVLVIMIMMYRKMEELTNQLAYLQDTSNIILSDVGGMQANIKKTLEEEASMIESYSIEIMDMDFSRRSYQVEVSVIPKEYTDNTKVSVYFGTSEYPLTLDGFVYKDSITLPIDKSFDGNVTFLLANGKKKSTEVLEGYDGLTMDLDKVLSGKIEAAPTYKDGELHLKTDCEFALNGVGKYEFDTLELVMQLGEEEIWTQNLLEDVENTTERQQNQGEQLDNTERSSEIGGESIQVSNHSGDVSCKLSYEMNKEGEMAGEDESIRIFLRAVSVNGYRFEYDVFQGDYLVAENRLDQENFDWSSHSVAYDDKGGKLELD